MSIIAFIFGRPLASSEGKKEQLTVLTGVPVLGLDAIASTGYGPEAALIVLLPLGAAGLQVEKPLQLQASKLQQPVVIIPIDGWHRVAEKAVRFGLLLSDDITAVHITIEHEDKRLLKGPNLFEGRQAHDCD